MTWEEINSLIAEGDPLMPKDWNLEKQRHLQEQRERVRLRSVAEFSSSPLYQARAEKDPTYWDNFLIGAVR